MRHEEARKENASRSGRILAEKTTKGGTPLWSLCNTTPILPTSTPNRRRFLAMSWLFASAILIRSAERLLPLSAGAPMSAKHIRAWRSTTFGCSASAGTSADAREGSLA